MPKNPHPDSDENTRDDARPEEAIDLDDFLQATTTSTTTAGDIVGFAGRALALPAALIAVGLTLLLGGSRWQAIRAQSRPVEFVAAVMLAVGAVVEALGFIVADASDVLSGQPGIAIALRLAAAAAFVAAARQRWPALALVASAGAIASFLFDGHTVTKGNRLITALADVVHVMGGAVWLGGVVAMVEVSRTADTAGQQQLAAFAVRFSVVAPVALGAVGVAGLALTVSILDSFSELWSTAWGQLVLVKTAIVAVALAMGAFNHFVLVPGIERGVGGSTARFARVVRIELIVLAAVTVTTAALVVAAS